MLDEGGFDSSIAADRLELVEEIDGRVAGSHLGDAVSMGAKLIAPMDRRYLGGDPRGMLAQSITLSPSADDQHAPTGQGADFFHKLM